MAGPVGRRRAKGAAPGTTGRVTPKGTAPGRPKPSGRYTPPTPKTVRTSPGWVPVVILALLLLGLVLIIVNYLGVLPGGASNWYLIVGLALIVAGFVTATFWH